MVELFCMRAMSSRILASQFWAGSLHVGVSKAAPSVVSYSGYICDFSVNLLYLEISLVAQRTVKSEKKRQQFGRMQ